MAITNSFSETDRGVNELVRQTRRHFVSSYHAERKGIVNTERDSVPSMDHAMDEVALASDFQSFNGVIKS